MKIGNLLLFLSPVIATVFGVFGQSIAYFLDDYIYDSYPIYYLTAMAGASIFLYLSSMLLIFIQSKRKKIQKDNAEVALCIIALVALPTTAWLLFVTAMWWG